MQTIPHDIDFEKYLALREYSDVRQASHWREALADAFANHGVQSGHLLPWQKTFNAVQLRPGEVSIWAGINGHSKSLVTGMMALYLMIETKVCIASMEMKPEKTLQRMVRQAAGCDNVARAYQERFMDWSDGRLWIYDRLDQVPTNTILGLISYCANELGITHIVIDSLMKCGIDEDDRNGEKRFVDQLCQLAKHHNVHIHLVAHMRKGESEAKRPGKFDVMGSSHITNLVDNLFIIHRNKAKEERTRLREDVDENEPDITLTVAKQRHGEWEGVFNFWFHAPSQQLTPWKEQRAMNFDIGPIA